jgi:hypothetical protein
VVSRLRGFLFRFRCERGLTKAGPTSNVLGGAARSATSLGRGLVESLALSAAWEVPNTADLVGDPLRQAIAGIRGLRQLSRLCKGLGWITRHSHEAWISVTRARSRVVGS